MNTHTHTHRFLITKQIYVPTCGDFVVSSAWLLLPRLLFRSFTLGDITTTECFGLFDASEPVLLVLLVLLLLLLCIGKLYTELAADSARLLTLVIML